MSKLQIALIIHLVLGCERKPQVVLGDLSVRAELGGKASSVTGLNWQGEDYLSIDQQLRLKLQLPSNRTIELESRPTFLTIVGDRLVRAKCTPLRKALSYEACLEEVRSYGKTLALTESTQWSKQMDKLTAERPEWSPSMVASMGVQIDEAAEMFCEIRPAREKDQWFISVSFSMIGPDQK